MRKREGVVGGERKEEGRRGRGRDHHVILSMQF